MGMRNLLAPPIPLLLSELLCAIDCVNCEVSQLDAVLARPIVQSRRVVECKQQNMTNTALLHELLRGQKSGDEIKGQSSLLLLLMSIQFVLGAEDVHAPVSLFGMENNSLRGRAKFILGPTKRGQQTSLT
jgi:hypothetical protein